MSSTREYTNWQDVIDLLRRAIESEQDEGIFKILLTSDERVALVSRVNIINELLKGEISQRHLSQKLGVGIATITRGSNELKKLDENQKNSLSALLERK